MEYKKNIKVIIRCGRWERVNHFWNYLDFQNQLQIDCYRWKNENPLINLDEVKYF